MFAPRPQKRDEDLRLSPPPRTSTTTTSSPLWRKTRPLRIALLLSLAAILLLNLIPDQYKPRYSLPSYRALHHYLRSHSKRHHPHPLPQVLLDVPAGEGLDAFRGPLENHTYLENGLVLVNEKGRHPIYDLVERAEREWEGKVERQSGTLEEAVREYARRYNRLPPRGFDKWWAYVQRHNVLLPDEYDQIMRDLAPFYAYSPSTLRRLSAPHSSNTNTYTIASSYASLKLFIRLPPSSSPNQTQTLSDAERAHYVLAEEQLDLLTGDGETWTVEGEAGIGSVERELIESTGEWNATFGAGEVPRVLRRWDVDEARRRSIKAEKFMIPLPHPSTTNYSLACPPHSPLLTAPLPAPAPNATALPLPLPDQKSFVHDPRAASDACLHPQLVHISGFLSERSEVEGGIGAGEGWAGRGGHELVFGTCKTGLHADVLVPQSEYWDPQEDVGGEVAWGDKADERMIWRGSTTPHTLPWRLSPRPRLLSKFASHPTRNAHSVLLPLPRSLPVGKPAMREAGWLDSVLADVKAVNLVCGGEGGKEGKEGGEGMGMGKGALGKEVCGEMNGTWEWARWAEVNRQDRYKYVMDIDGEGCSARFKRLMSSNSVVLKATIFTEWYSDRIAPWVHYVPVKMDLSDLYDVLSFFRGDVLHGGAGHHDELAERIAAAGREWSRRYWRREDMIAYTYRLMLEYGRLVSDDRDKMNFYM